MKEKYVLTIKNKSEVLYLRVDNILYIQADGNYCNVYFADGGVLNTLTYQRAEIARMLDEQLPKKNRMKFALLSQQYKIKARFLFCIVFDLHYLCRQKS